MGTCCGGGIHLSLAAPQQGQPVRLKRGRFLRALKVDFTPQASLRNPDFPLSFSFQQDNQPKKRRRGKKCHPWHLLCPFSISFRFHGNPKPVTFLSAMPPPLPQACVVGLSPAPRKPCLGFLCLLLDSPADGLRLSLVLYSKEIETSSPSGCAPPVKTPLSFCA